MQISFGTNMRGAKSGGDEAETPAESTDGPSRPTAAVLWAHSDPDWQAEQRERWKESVLRLTRLLRDNGIDADVDLFHGHEPTDWARFGARAIEASDWVLVAVSPEWRRAFQGLNKPTESAGTVGEANTLLGMFKNDQAEFQQRVVLVLLPGRETSDVPPALVATTTYVRVPSLTSDGVEDLLRILHGRPAYPKTVQQGRPTERLHFVRSVAADLPSSEDLLGFDPLVKALHGLLNDASTVLPLAIAVTAPWGAGKSSVMIQLQEALHDEHAAVGAHRTWATVRFDAWKYERGERLWAALAKAIYSQPQRRMSPLQLLSFRVRLELRRRGVLASIATIAWPCLVIAVIVLAAIRVRISGVGAVPAVIAAAAVTLGTLTRYGNALANPFKRAIERHARAPDYEAHLGFTSEADRDIRVLTRLIAPDEQHGLAVFVDDLDRCSSAHLVEIVEAMNQIFNSASDHRCVFVLGLDRDVVTSNINVAYASTVEQLRKDRNALGERFGLEFLAKLVQLSVSIPEPTPAALQTLMEKVTGNIAATDEGTQGPGEEEVARVQASIQSASGLTLASVADVGAHMTQAPSAVVAAAVRRELAERIEDSREVAHAEFAALPYLERNPRQLKRFHNAFRLQLYVANEDENVPFEFTAAELIALAKWVIVRLRWPDLGNAIAQDPPLLLLLEAEANKEPSSVSLDLVDAQRIEERDRWLARTGVRPLMSERDRTRRLSALELKRFLRVA